jgi:parallel beta-helix repeat protein
VLIEGNVVSGSTRDGIAVQDASNVSVLGNRVRRAQRSGVFVDGATGSVVVADNACDDNGQAGLADAWFGVLIQNVAEATLAGNVCHDTQGDRATQRHGLAVNATRVVTLRDNLAAGNRVSAYREMSPPAEIRRSSNVFDGIRDDARRLIAAWSPPRLAPGAQTLVTLTLSGADLGDLVVSAFSHDLRGLQLTAYVGAKNSVTVVLRNGTAAPTTLPPGHVKVQLIK